jgi:hypothetical protein
LTINIFNKIPSAVKRASILDLKLMQAFTRVSLARNPITSFIFWIRSLDLLQDFALTLYSETPHTKQSKGLLSGKLESQTSSTHTSVRFSLSQSCILLLSWAVLLSCLGISSYLSTILRHNLLIFAMFILINFSNFFQLRKQCVF